MSRALLSLAVLLLVDVVLLVWIGRHTSGTFVLVLVIAGCVAGMATLRGATRRRLRAMEADLRAGRPASESVRAALATVVAAILFIVPGILSDLLAVLLLVPVSRRLVSSWLARWWVGRIERDGFSGWAGQFQDTAGRDRVIDVRVVDASSERAADTQADE